LVREIVAAAEEVFTTPDPAGVSGYVASTRPLALRSGPVVRGLRVRFEGGVAVEVETDANAEASLR
jgi:leucyl aminopeptidase (aminopeptidase T)